MTHEQNIVYLRWFYFNEDPEKSGDWSHIVKRNSLNLIIFGLLIVGGIVTFFIVYKDIDHSFSSKFVVGYIFFMFLYVLYFTILVIFNISKLKWVDLRKRLIKFVAYFVLLFGVSYLVGLIYKPIELNRMIAMSLQLSFIFVFIDLLFNEKKTNNGYSTKHLE